MGKSRGDASTWGSRSFRTVSRLTVVACVLLIFVAAWALAGQHTPDSKLERRFLSNEAGFAALLAEVSADDRLEGLSADRVRYADRIFSPGDSTEMERLGFSRERWARYREEIRKLGIAGVSRADGIVEFRVDQGSLWNGDFYKGYEYSLVPPAGRRKASLDKYRLSEDDKIRFGGYQVYKPIKGNWYLYLFISGGS